jgi:hypothetical protein
MGQPWLRAAAAEISYGSEKGDSMRIRIYEQGDTNKNSLIVNLNVDHTRAATRLVHQVEITDNSTQATEPVSQTPTPDNSHENDHEAQQDSANDSTPISVDDPEPTTGSKLDSASDTKAELEAFFKPTGESWFQEDELEDAWSAFKTLSLGASRSKKRILSRILEEDADKEQLDRIKREHIIRRINARHRRLNQAKRQNLLHVNLVTRDMGRRSDAAPDNPAGPSRTHQPFRNITNQRLPGTTLCSSNNRNFCGWEPQKGTLF